MTNEQVFWALWSTFTIYACFIIVAVNRSKK